MAEKVAWQLRMGWIAVGLIALTGCSSTQLTSTWSPPDAQPITFQKVLVVCITEDKVTRHVAEDALVQEVKRAEAVPSYQLIPDAELRDHKKVRTRMVAAGFDGAVTMRLPVLVQLPQFLQLLRAVLGERLPGVHTDR